MKNLKGKLGNCLWAAAFAATYLVPVGILEAKVASRQQVTIDGLTENVNVMRDHTVSFNLRNVRIENGRFITQTGSCCARGRPPIWHNAPSTPHEIAVYRAIF